MSIKKLLLLSSFFLSFLMASDYPKKPVTLIVPYGAGGASDLVGRAVASSSEKYLKQPVVVVNKKGNSGVIGANFVSQAKPDGYTLLLARPIVSIYPAVNPKANLKWDDYSFIGYLGAVPFVLVVNADSPYQTAEELFEAIKDNPGKLTYAAAGPIAADGLATQTLLLDNHLDPLRSATLIPYNGGGAVISALLGKHVDFVTSPAPPLIPLIQSKKLRALTMLSPRRADFSPDVPSAKELGFKYSSEITSWGALYGPKNLPQEVIDQWKKILVSLKSDQEWIKLAKDRGDFSDIGEFEQASFAKSQYELFHQLAKSFGYIH